MTAFGFAVMPVPKQGTAERLRTKETARRERRAANLSRSRQKQRTTYGGSDWPKAKAACLARDGHRCIFRCVNQLLAVTAHHWNKTVGAGGKNDLPNLAALCAFCHDAAHAGRIGRESIRQCLIELHGPSAVEGALEL
ncbi:MAG TPA: HNH endonuclease [Chloroflexota bacterium]|nr:HNH endonuclease [Chloroflexota bacterium]